MRRISFTKVNLILSVSIISYLVFSPLVFAGIENRPLNSDEATILDKGVFVIATGETFLKQPNRDKEWDWVTDLEYGVFNNLEFDLEIPRGAINYKDNTDQKDVNGLGDITTWLEYTFFKEKEIIPAMSFAFSIKTQSGSKRKGLGSGENNYQFTWLVSKNVGSFCAIVNSGYTIVGEPPDTDYRDTFSCNAALEYMLNKKIMLVSEIYGQTNQDKSADKDPLDILGGFVYTLNDHIAIDFGIGAGLANASPDLRVTNGMTYAF